jgi:hypothetical protein
VFSYLANRYRARNILDIPVPKVLAWHSHAHQNPVGAEYIIMEEVPGVELEHVWPDMSIQDIFAVVKSIAGFQKACTSVAFTKYGSLYFSRDLEDMHGSQPLYIDANGHHITNENFAVGPSVARETFDSGRAAINFDRGPCKSVIKKNPPTDKGKGILCMRITSQLDTAN